MKARLVSLLLLLGILFRVAWASPVNDAFANRIVIAGLTNTMNGSNVGATKELGEPDHGGVVGGKSVWWTWTAPSNGVVVIDTFGSSFDTVLAAYTGVSVSNLIEQASNDQYGTNDTSIVSFLVTANTQYQIAVDGYDGGSGAAEGNIVLHLRWMLPPANDNFTNRIAINGLTNTVTGYNYGATKELGEPDHAGVSGGKSVWWRWTAPTNGTVTIDTMGSDFDTVLGIYSGGSISNLTLVASDDDRGGGVRSRVVFLAVAGVSYQIAVDGYSRAGVVLLHVRWTPPRVVPANDLFANRVAITGLTNTVTGYNVSATKQAGESNHAGNAGGHSVWWSWTAPTNGTVTMDTLGSTFDTLLAAYTGNPVTNLVEQSSDDQSGPTNTSLIRFSTTSGTQYQIAVDGYNGGAGADEGDVRLNLVWIPPPANDLFANRTSISGLTNTAISYNFGAGKELGETNHAGNVGGHSVWWSWTAPTNGTVTIDTIGSDFDTLLGIYTGSSVANLTLVASDDGHGGTWTGSSRVVFQAAVGTTYQIAVDGKNYGSGEVGNVVLNVRWSPPRAAPGNDQFANRIAITGLTNTAAGYNVSATKQAGESNHAGNIGGHSVWWSWTAPSNGMVTLDTGGSSFDTLLAAYTGTNIANLTEQASNDQYDQWWPSNTSLVSFSVTVGRQYQIAVDGYNGGAGADEGDVRLNLAWIPSPVNDLFADRIIISGLTNTVVGKNIGAGKELGETNHAGNVGGKSVWWSWTAPTNGTVTIDTTGSTFFALLAVYVGSSISNLIAVPSISQTVGIPSVVVFPCVAGVTYQIAVDGVSGASGGIVVNLRTVPLIPVPPNDLFVDRIYIEGQANSLLGYNVGATKEPGETNHAGNIGGHSVWWSWSSTTNGMLTVDTVGSSFSTVLAVYMGTSITDLVVQASSSSVGGSNSSSVTFEISAGWQYQIAVDGAGGAVGSISLNLKLAPATGPMLQQPAYTFTTLAGRPALGSADGVGDTAQFNNPRGIAVDGSGNLYVSDTGNSTIRKITPAGVVTTLAGFAGSADFVDGSGTAARFLGPYGGVVDSSGTLYVADYGNSVIRKIAPSGLVTTFAGSGAHGSTDGAAGSARFSLPTGVAIDNAKNLYVTDSGNATIRMITPGGVVSTLAGVALVSGTNDGMGNVARFNFPTGIALDGAGNIYVSDSENCTIRKISPVGTNWVVSTIAGLAGAFGTNDGIGSAARFSYPLGIAADAAGNVYVTDSSSTIRKLTPIGTNWVVSTLAGLALYNGSDDGTGATARFHSPYSIAVDNDGNLYVADSGNNTVRKVTAAGVVSTVAGLAQSSGTANGTGANARFAFNNNAAGTAADSAGNIYVADSHNHTIRKVTPAGVVSTIAGLAGSYGVVDGTGSNARFLVPSGIAVDSIGNVFAADAWTIRKISAAGVVSTLAGSNGGSGTNDGTGTSARFNSPAGIAIGNSGKLYVADTYNHTVRMLTPVGTNWVVTTIAGTAGTSGTNDGLGLAARFNRPYGITLDGAGNLYVPDYGSLTIRKLQSVGTNWLVTTIAGFANNGYGNNVDGVGSDARFDSPSGIAIDHMGNLFVTDVWTIRKLVPVGTNWEVNTIGGAFTSFGSADGIGTEARFYYPSGIAADNAGNIYIADGQNTIRKGTFTQYSPSAAASYSPSPMSGQITVTLLPPEANGQWRFPWEFGWHNSGYTAVNLAAGDYPIEFRGVAGWLAVPLSGPVTLSEGATLTVTNVYYPTIGAGDTNSTPGTLTIFLGPTPPPGAGWRFLGDNASYLPNGYTTNLLPGTYLIEFAGVSGRVKPASQAVQITAGQPAFLSVNYLLAATPPVSTYLPFPVPSNQVGDESTYPFGFNGQLQSDNGYGSGVAVANNVVLTAAHLVFNDQTLSYVSRAHWFFRRDSGVSEPLPQAARSFFVQSGYAAQRTNDLASGYSPDQSTPPSRNVDVAALYFQTPVAGGGSGGYLPSDAVPNTWLTSTALKMLVGYPVDGSQFGAVVTAGKMYQSDPQPYPLSVAPDPVPGQQEVYLAPWLLSYPGNSGGPLYVQLNGYYYPAAVYLGTLFSGSQPYASVVRAIDSSVVNLITNAVALGDTGTNNTGGGVITVIPSLTVSSTRPAYMRWQLEPPAAVRAGAAWRVVGDSTYSTATNYTRQVTTTNAFGVEFKPIPGWNLPTNQTALLQPGQVLTSTGFYTVTNPVLVANGSGLGITGTTDTVYRIEGRSSLTTGSWQPVSTNTILTNGLNPVLNNLATNGPAKFYRALWLP